MREITSIDIGDDVLCDSCGADYTKSDECGGLLVHTAAYCPKCGPRIEQDLKKYGEEDAIRGRCPEGKPYRKWVLEDLRKGNNKIIIEAGRNTELNVRCELCRTWHALVVTHADKQDWINGKHVQDAFPYLSAEQRELLISRVCPKCFDKLFKEIEDA
jgi:hypothetical protein